MANVAKTKKNCYVFFKIRDFFSLLNSPYSKMFAYTKRNRKFFNKNKKNLKKGVLATLPNWPLLTKLRYGEK